MFNKQQQKRGSHSQIQAAKTWQQKVSPGHQKMSESDEMWKWLQKWSE